VINIKDGELLFVSCVQLPCAWTVDCPRRVIDPTHVLDQEPLWGGIQL